MHGIANTVQNFGINYDSSEGDYLIFENECGVAHFFS